MDLDEVYGGVPIVGALRRTSLGDLCALPPTPFAGESVVGSCSPKLGFLGLYLDLDLDVDLDIGIGCAGAGHVGEDSPEEGVSLEGEAWALPPSSSAPCPSLGEDHGAVAALLCAPPLSPVGTDADADHVTDSFWDWISSRAANDLLFEEKKEKVKEEARSPQRPLGAGAAVPLPKKAGKKARAASSAAPDEVDGSALLPPLGHAHLQLPTSADGSAATALAASSSPSRSKRARCSEGEGEGEDPLLLRATSRSSKSPSRAPPRPTPSDVDMGSAAAPPALAAAAALDPRSSTERAAEIVAAAATAAKVRAAKAKPGGSSSGASAAASNGGSKAVGKAGGKASALSISMSLQAAIARFLSGPLPQLNLERGGAATALQKAQQSRRSARVTEREVVSAAARSSRAKSAGQKVQQERQKN